MNHGPPDEPAGVPTRIRHPVLWIAVVAVLTAILAWVVLTVTADVRAREFQDALQPFYTPPSPLPAGHPGQVLRTEKLDVDVPGGTGYRILYRSEDDRGNPTVASGMVFVPTGQAPAAGRPVVAWAHGTIGLGTPCAPSRSQTPLSDLPWLGQMLQQGWVVTATDYAGLGTPGTPGYLVLQEEARDVANSVRAARTMAGAHASNRWIAWGHSQGGHAALASGDIAPGYAPDLDLVAVAAAAPPVEWKALLAQQWNTAIAWVIGSDVVATWPAYYPGLAPGDVVTANGANHYASEASACVKGALTTALVRQNLLGQDFFRIDPWNSPPWRARFRQNTPRPMPASIPLLLIQGLDDQVVIPNTTALMLRRWCAAGSRITTMWLGDTPHQTTAWVAAPTAIGWMAQRFAGQQATDDCALTPPVAAYHG